MAHDVAMASDPADAGISHDRFCNMASIKKIKSQSLGNKYQRKNNSLVLSDPEPGYELYKGLGEWNLGNVI